jgi:hypothetical protein
MVVSLLPKIEPVTSGDHRYALPVVRPLPRPAEPATPRTW